jgi:hypothetical protein
MNVSENELWMASFYRTSEISGALFFGRVARTIRGPLQKDVTHHFADESAHASYWTDCIVDGLGVRSIPMRDAYQDRYMDAVGVPANLMEVMAITQVFEKRVITQYNQHMRRESTPDPVRATIEKIMRDERWHVRYVRDALKGMEQRYGAEEIKSTLDRYTVADQEIYAKAIAELDERFAS